MTLVKNPFSGWEEMTFDVETAEGYEVFTYQLFSMTGIAPERQRIFGLNVLKSGILDPVEFNNVFSFLQQR